MNIGLALFAVVAVMIMMATMVRTPAAGYGLVAIGGAANAALEFMIPNVICHVLGAMSCVIALVALWRWWNGWRDKRRRAMQWIGEKSRALRDALVRELRERWVPVPSPTRA